LLPRTLSRATPLSGGGDARLAAPDLCLARVGVRARVRVRLRVRVRVRVRVRLRLTVRGRGRAS
jgi:hypothetical protein